MPNFKTARTTKGFDVRLSAGVNYFFSSHFALTARLGALSYESTQDKTEGIDFTTKKNIFRLNTNLQDVSFGLLYRI